jgi:hypothetical protein
MQAFWVRVKSGFNTGSLTFQNIKRSHIDDVSNVLRAPASKTLAEPMLRLQVSNGLNYDETVLYSNANASNGYDDYDSQKFSNSSASIPEIYTLAGNEHLAINGMKSIPVNTEIQLGFTPGSSTSFSIKASAVTNFETGTQIFLKDNALGTIQDITDGTPYTFTPNNTVAADQRFALLFKVASINTGINPLNGGNGNDSGVIVTRNADNRITINCLGSLTGESSVVVYNSIGKKLVANQLTRSVTVLDHQLEAGAYLVIVKNGGKSVTQKVILN